jgi:hypothetical protein
MPNPPGVSIIPSMRVKVALGVAVVADILQLAVFPYVMEGALSPADDMIDLCVAGLMGALLGWHWEFLPSFLGKLVPGVDLAPLWTLAVANVYRKQKALAAAQGFAVPDQSAEADSRKA